MPGLPLMALGLFVFSMDTLPYQQFQQRYGWRWPSNSRVGQRPAYQYCGVDEECISLSGKLMPELTGGETALSMLKLMADQGSAWPLIEGTGVIYGFFIIEGLEITRQSFFRDGKARELEFTLSLKRIDDSQIDLLGVLERSIMDLAAS